MGRPDRKRYQDQGGADAQAKLASADPGSAPSPGLPAGFLGSDHGSGSGARDEPAEPALAALVFGNRVLECRAVEIRPIDRKKPELAVGGLPQQEIGKPLLAAGADDEVRVGQVGRIEIAGNELRRDFTGSAL